MFFYEANKSATSTYSWENLGYHQNLSLSSSWLELISFLLSLQLHHYDITVSDFYLRTKYSGSEALFLFFFMTCTLKRLWESWERTACRRSSVWGSGTVSIPAPSNSFLNRAAYATASGGWWWRYRWCWCGCKLGWFKIQVQQSVKKNNWPLLESELASFALWLWFGERQFSCGEKEVHFDIVVIVKLCVIVGPC